MEDNCFTMLCCCVSAIQQRESARSIHIPPLSWAFLPPHPTHPTHLSCHRGLCWTSCVVQQLPITYLFLHMVMYMFQCYPLNSSHTLLSPLCPQICSLCLCFHCCPANKFISTIFLDSIYMHEYTTFVFVFVLLTSLCITGSRFIHLSLNDSNSFLFVAE